jgi:hypothetical protein
LTRSSRPRRQILSATLSIRVPLSSIRLCNLVCNNPRTSTKPLGSCPIADTETLPQPQ